MSESIAASSSQTPERSEWLPWTVFALLAVRLLWRVSRLAVDIPFWDQWDFWNPIFNGSGPWTFFRWQHGPERQGLGGLVLWATAHASGLSVRAETFVSTGIVIAGAALGMLLARRLRGRLDALDAALPLILLAGLHADAITMTPNPAHGPVPFLLLCAAPLAFTVPQLAVRLPLVVAVTAAAANTGFTWLLVPPVLVLQAVDLWRAPARVRVLHAVALGASILLSAAFLVGLVPDTAVECYAFPDPQPLRYAPFVSLVLGRPFGISSWRGANIVLASASTLAVVTAGGWGAVRSLSRRADESARAAFLLCGFAVLFAAATAIGRVCLGLGAAAAERYVPYVLPGLAVAYMVLRTRVPPVPVRSAAIAVALFACVGKEAWLAMHPVAGIVRIAEGKRRFLACVRAGGNAAECTRRTAFEIYPRPEATQLEAKLSMLRERRLGPFR